MEYKLKSKSQFWKIFGDWLSGQGVKLEKTKIEAILDIPRRQKYLEVNGLLLRKNRIVIPECVLSSLRGYMKDIHVNRKIKTRAREAIYWPGINAYNEKMVNRCETS